jgi:hypothetical protein
MAYRLPFLFRGLPFFFVGAACAFFGERDARACGGCFHAETDTSSSFVTDHRMVVSVSPQQTVLWDQVEFSGEPTEFAWVLPVRDGSRVELARAEWIEALDVATQPSIKGPDLSCGGGGGGGIGCGGMSSEDSLASAPGSGYTSADGGYQSGGGVEVVSQSVVGPYESVIVRSSKGEAIYLWLRINHFAVPDAIEPILSQYTGEGFDFLAIRLRPGQGVRSMQPVRVVMPGAGSSLPLRMVAAGIGARVGITLFVVSEGRYHTRNFPDAKLDRSALAWDNRTSKSNYRELMEDALAKTGGRGWATEYAGKLFTIRSNAADYITMLEGSNTTQPLDTLYKSACGNLAPQTVECDGGFITPTTPPSFFDGGSISDGGDAGEFDGAAADAGPVQVPRPCTRRQNACELFDDADVALKGLHRSDVWVTRMRAELSGSDCASGDLELEPSLDSTALPAKMQTNKFTDPNFDPCAASDDSSGSCACHTTPQRRVPAMPLLLGAFGIFSMLRGLLRRRR